MKTTSFRYSNYPTRITQTDTIKGEKKAELRIVLKSDFRNHRFAIIDNNRIQDPSNWDASWFGNYE